MLRSWTGAVEDLAEHYDPSHVHRMSVAGSLDEEDAEVAAVAAAAAAAAAAAGGDDGAAPTPAQRQPAPIY
jgi:hypothetical protein